MKQFIAFVKKEFYHIFRDRRTMLILLGMPVVEIILFGFAITTEVKNVRLAVLDPSNDMVTRKIIDRLDASEYFTVTTRFHSPQEMEAAFRKNKIDMAIVFGERFAVFAQFFDKGNTTQRVSGDFARHLLANFPSCLFHVTKDLTTHLSHNLCAVLP